MKKLFAITIGLSLLTSAAFASNAKNTKYSYCEDIRRVDSLLDRSRESVDRLLAEKIQIERIVVSKDRKELYLISGDTMVRYYPVAFGFSPFGHKQFEGDGRTPEGLYYIDYKNPQSQFTKSLHVSYPNKGDLSFAKSKGKSAGGDIMVHGLPSDDRKRQLISKIHPMNWTQGCIAVNNEQMEEIYALVQTNTLIEICASSTEPPKRVGAEESEEDNKITIPAK